MGSTEACSCGGCWPLLPVSRRSGIYLPVRGENFPAWPKNYVYGSGILPGPAFPKDRPLTSGTCPGKT